MVEVVINNLIFRIVSERGEINVSNANLNISSNLDSVSKKTARSEDVCTKILNKKDVSHVTSVIICYPVENVLNKSKTAHLIPKGKVSVKNANLVLNIQIKENAESLNNWLINYKTALKLLITNA